ncbi:hypothetical protein FZEAL_8961 [Fusarium zealandicum]|uniref:BTB domain-containing protein n=1 Tax=Fusarium zealandicum TaxID=1053134 RepID=A0A8H4UDE0_9HYPO|nr:hypothetical protein FZEAL_8961 [Fusarium zealandicum]
MTPQGFQSFLSSLKNLCDAVVVCDGRDFKAHRIILSAHSKCFAKELNGNWKESSERKIEIQDFDSSIVEAMIHFMYSFNYDNIYGTSTMVFNAQVYQIADKYDISALKPHSKDKFGAAITTGWSMDDFPTAIAVVYESTPSGDRGLRDLAVETSHKNIDDLVTDDGFCELLRKTPDFAADLIPFLCGNTGKKSTVAKRTQFSHQAHDHPKFRCADLQMETVGNTAKSNDSTRIAVS